jgi:hypothetical protein
MSQVPWIIRIYELTDELLTLWRVLYMVSPIPRSMN